MAYATLAQLLDYMNKKTPTQDEEVALLGYLDAATENIDRVLNRWRAGFEHFAAPAVATPRVFAARGKGTLQIDDCITVTLVESRTPGGAWTAWDAGDWLAAQGSGRWVKFDALPYNVLLVNAGGNYLRFPGTTTSTPYPNVRVTARWGYSAAPPPDIVAVCIEQAARWFKNAQSAMQDALADENAGTLLYSQPMHAATIQKLTNGRYYRPALGG